MNRTEIVYNRGRVPAAPFSGLGSIEEDHEGIRAEAWGRPDGSILHKPLGGFDSMEDAERAILAHWGIAEPVAS
jgi:hypothetical protein